MANGPKLECQRKDGPSLACRTLGRRGRLRDVRGPEIRYVHTMSHPDYPGDRNVGCVCAEEMEDNYVRPRLREKALRSAAGRKQRWLSRKWQVSACGDS